MELSLSGSAFELPPGESFSSAMGNNSDWLGNDSVNDNGDACDICNLAESVSLVSRDPVESFD